MLREIVKRQRRGPALRLDDCHLGVLPRECLLAHCASDAEFYDQSAPTHDFKRWHGITPFQFGTAALLVRQATIRTNTAGYTLP